MLNLDHTTFRLWFVAPPHLLWHVRSSCFPARRTRQSRGVLNNMSGIWKSNNLLLILSTEQLDLLRRNLSYED
jgi:hypothetical protein